MSLFGKHTAPRINIADKLARSTARFVRNENGMHLQDFGKYVTDNETIFCFGYDSIRPRYPENVVEYLKNENVSFTENIKKFELMVYVKLDHRHMFFT